MSYNKVTILGNLCRDPEIRYSANGIKVASLGVAVNRQWKDEAGEKREEVSFIDCTAFGKTADLIGQYFKKGQPILFDGRLKQESWVDKSTEQNRSKLIVIIEQLTFLPRNEGERADVPVTQPRRQAPARPVAKEADPYAGPKEEDDVPF